MTEPMTESSDQGRGGLSEAEREALLGSVVGWAGESADLDDCRNVTVHIAAQVERILADRLAAVQAEVAEQDREHEKTLSIMEAACDRAESAEAENARLRARLGAVEALAEEPETNYPDNCGCSHGMGFQFHTYPCRFSESVPRRALRAALASPTSHAQREAEVGARALREYADLADGRERNVWDLVAHELRARADALAADTGSAEG